MNENPEGTPNPLNPNPGATPMGTEPVAPAPEPMPKVQSVTPQPAQQSPQPAPSAQPVASEPQAEPIVAAPTTEVTMDSAPAKPKKTGLIIAIVLFVVAIIAGVAATIIVLNPFGSKKDAVPAAISKLFSGDAPSNVSMNGKITLVPNNETIPVTSLVVDFKAGVKNSSFENYVNATVTATFTDENEFTFNADEVRTAGGDLYLRLSNIAEVLSNLRDLATEQNCLNDETGESNCVEEIDYEATDCVEGEGCEEIDAIMLQPDESVFDFLEAFEAVDNEWVRVPGSSFSFLTDIADVGGPTQCLVEAAGKMSEYGKDFTDLYKNNPFITYSTDNLKIAQKNSQLYLLGFDADKMAGFINGMSNYGFMNEMLACMGDVAVNEEVTPSNLQEIISSLPTIYVEIDDNDNFTRVYLTVDSSDGTMGVTADISLAYPASISVEEPEVYIDINDVLSQSLTMFYNQDDVNFITE